MRSRLRDLSPRALAIAAALLTALIALVVFLATMSDSAVRRTGTNSLGVPTHAIVGPGQRLCQNNEFVPKGSRAVAPWVGGTGGAPGGPVSITVSSRGRVLARGRSPQSYPTGITQMRLDRTIVRDVHDASVCFTNRAAVPLNMYGDYAINGAPPADAPQFEADLPAIVRLDWYADRTQSWWHTLGSMADRFPLMKAGFLGPWAFWLALVSMLALSVAAVVRVVREVRP